MDLLHHKPKSSRKSRSPVEQTFKRKIKIVATSDQHTGHNSTPTFKVLAALDSAYRESVLVETDIAVLSGDFFDHDLSMAQPEVDLIYNWIFRFLTQCALHQVKVRVLEGTPSHDAKQPRWFVEIAQSHKIPVDLKYMSSLEIEYLPDYDMTILYIPDEYRPRCEDTKQEVIELMATKGLEQVDMAVMHGCFPHQFPKFLHSQIDSHDPDFYLSIVRQYIVIGHVHTFSQYRRILAPGSIERTSHGQEEPKGHLVLDLDLDHPKRSKVEFIENRLAMRYVTFNLNDESVSQHHYRLNALLNDLPAGSYVRLRGSVNHPFAASLKELKDTHSLFVWSFKKEDEENKVQELTLDSVKEELRALPSITPDNLFELIAQRVNHDPKVLEILKECMNV